MDTNIVNSKEFADKIYKKLEPSGWNSVLRMYIKSNEFTNLIEALKIDISNGYRFTPTFKHVFKAFEICPYNDVKVVIVGSAPFPEINAADGLLLSSSRLKKPDVDTVKFTDAIKESISNPLALSDFSYLAEQGVLLLNSSLTTRINNTKDHAEHWKSFMSYLFDELSSVKEDLVYLLLGNVAKEWEDLIESTNVITIDHPEENDSWNYQDCFNKVNEILALQELPSIKW
jgi:uracil-DNA glycosylase